MRRKSLFGYVLQRLYTSGWEVKVLYAIVETAGRQYKVEEGKILYTEKQTEYAPGDEIVLTEWYFSERTTKCSWENPMLKVLGSLERCSNTPKPER